MSRSRHVKDIDKNTRYFHNLASARRRNNRIDVLLINGRLIRNQARIKIEIRDFYKKLYHQEKSPLVGFRDGLVEMIGGIGGATDSRGAVVLDFFLSSKLPADANLTWVALVPKFKGTKEIKYLRPISIVGCVYKVISKMLIKMRKKEAVIMKLNFQKAYDRVKWSFVDLVLQKMGFGRRWRNLVMECVSTSSMSVLINGSSSKPFKMERGLRQGDPRSPFLFVLVVDVLHRMLGEAVRNGHISLLLWVQRMSRVLGCKIASLPVKYLGIPLGANPSLPVYYLNLYKMPKAMAKKLIFLQRRFLWSKEDGRNGVTFSGGPWRDICQIQFKDQQVRQKMINGLAMEIGDGRGTRFWEDVWLRSGSLKDLFSRLFSVSNQTGSVIRDCGFWDGEDRVV
ncbi:uncharacterized protein LOC107615137 [Arachis ipaensis]|uniref:uncharacterized protein LOC107615137 n=1 Tax=Arachis ipaensis TaxID=130454 RepID=UPI0007AEF6F4|nr:uncharacterized protein LOC107615137 [Arachis ipaensis]